MSVARVVLAALLALGGPAAAAELETPLGGWARPGVPVLLASPDPVRIEVGGWPHRVEGTTAVFAPALPCAVTLGGREVARLEPVPAATLLIGVAGADPAVVARGAGEGAIAVAVRLDGLGEEDWPVLDLFDRIVIGGGATPGPAARHALARWVRAGGSLLAVGFDEAFAGGTGLGSFRRAADLGRLLDDSGPPRPPLVPRAGATARAVYDLVRPPARPGPTGTRARWIVLAAAAALLLQLALARLARLERRAMLVGLAVVVAVGTLLGMLRTRAEYDPLVRGTVEVVYRDRGWQRVRRWEVGIAVGPGAAMRPDPLAVPAFFRAAGEPWWTTSARRVPVPGGQQRLFRTESVARASTPDGASWAARTAAGRPGPDLRAFVRAAAPEGWRVLAVDGPFAPRAGRGDPGRLLRLELAPQD